jgi:hypothetical protein
MMVFKRRTSTTIKKIPAKTPLKRSHSLFNKSGVVFYFYTSLECSMIMLESFIWSMSLRANKND